MKINQKHLLNLCLYLDYYKKDITDRYRLMITNISLDKDVLNNIKDNLYITKFDKYNKLQQENKQLKDNWNKLKEYLHNVDVVVDYSENYDGRFINYDELIDKMQELKEVSE